MRIEYDDIFEVSQVVIRCNNTANKGMCKYCPFYDGCVVDEDENRAVLCGSVKDIHKEI